MAQLTDQQLGPMLPEHREAMTSRRFGMMIVWLAHWLGRDGETIRRNLVPLRVRYDDERHRVAILGVSARFDPVPSAQEAPGYHWQAGAFHRTGHEIEAEMRFVLYSGGTDAERLRWLTGAPLGEFTLLDGRVKAWQLDISDFRRGEGLMPVWLADAVFRGLARFDAGQLIVQDGLRGQEILVSPSEWVVWISEPEGAGSDRKKIATFPDGLFYRYAESRGWVKPVPQAVAAGL